MKLVPLGTSSSPLLTQFITGEIMKNDLEEYLFYNREWKDYIKLDQLNDRHVYYIYSRNLTYGVYDAATQGFVGIRLKFGDRYLFKEFHWDCQYFPTVKPIKDLGKIPDNLIVAESLGTECYNCKTKVEFDKPVMDGGKGWVHLDKEDCGKCMPVSILNTELFDYLDRLKK